MRERRRAREEGRQVNNFKEAVCCPYVVVQGVAQQKNDLCKGSVWGNWNPWESQQLFRPNPNGVGECTTTLRRLLIDAVRLRFASFVGLLDERLVVGNSKSVSLFPDGFGL